MLSPRLIQRIEENWEAIAAQVIHETRRDQQVIHYHQLTEFELRERAHDVVKNLVNWLSTGREDDVALRYESLGRRRCRDGVPLHEVVYKLSLIRRCISTYVMEQNLNLTPIQIYEELELLRSLNRFFDLVVPNVVRGYEAELRELMRNGEAHPFRISAAMRQRLSA